MEAFLQSASYAAFRDAGAKVYKSGCAWQGCRETTFHADPCDGDNAKMYKGCILNGTLKRRAAHGLRMAFISGFFFRAWVAHGNAYQNQVLRPSFCGRDNMKY